MSNFWFHHATVGIYLRKRPPRMPLLLRNGQAHSHTSPCPCYFLCLEACPSKFAHGWKPFKSQLRCQHLWQVAGGHLSRLVPSLHRIKWHRVGTYILSWEDKCPLMKPPLDYLDKEYYLIHFGTQEAISAKKQSLPGVSRLLSNWQCGKHQPGAILSFLPASERLPFRCR